LTVTGLKVSESINVTQVRNYISPYTGSVNPYLQPHINNPAGGSCVPSDPDCCGDYSTNSCKACGVPLPTDTISCSVNNSVIYQGNFWNCFTTTTKSIDTHCPPDIEFGHKQLYSKKNWLGIFGYTSPFWQTPDSNTYCCNCNALTAQTASATIDQTKYLKVSGSATKITNNINSITGNTTYTATAANIVELDRYSGEIIVDLATSSSNDPGDPTANAAWAILTQEPTETANSNIHNLLTNYCNYYASDITAYGPPTVVTSTGNNSWHIEFHTTLCDIDRIATSYDISPTSMTRQSFGHNNDLDPCNWQMFTNQTWSYTNTSYSYNSTTYITGGNADYHQEITKSVTGYYSNIYTAQQAYQDVVTASQQWDLDNEFQYQYRQDNSLVAPLTGYDEWPTGLSLIFGYTSGSNGGYTGDMIGGPLPIGYDHYFNQTYQVWEICQQTCDGGGTIPNYYWSGTGAWSDGVFGCNVPLATNWTTALDAATLFYGKFVGMNFRQSLPNCAGTTNQIIDDCIWLGDYRETKVPRPSYNYSRPCGCSDRWTISPTTSSCIIGTTANVLSLSDYTNITNQLINVCGTGTVNDGIWSGYSVSSDKLSITLTTQKTSGSQINQSCSFGPWVGALQYPSASALCGRAYITGIHSGTSSLDRSTCLVDNDIVYTDNGLLTQSIKVFDSLNILLPQSGSVNYIYSPGSPDWKWDDTTEKGNFLTAEFDINYNNFRQMGEYNRLVAQAAELGSLYQCDGTTPCNIPPVISYPTPTGPIISQSCVGDNPCDAFEIYRYYFPSNLIFDSTYGTFWQKISIQSINDPLWLPPKNCNGGAITEDPGDCTGNYPHADQIEAEFPPSGSPAMPIPFIYPGPPQQGVFPLNQDVSLWLAESSCICDMGSFSGNYEDNGVYCINYPI
jgi:hypothetical protein